MNPSIAPVCITNIPSALLDSIKEKLTFHHVEVNGTILCYLDFNEQKPTKEHLIIHYKVTKAIFKLGTVLPFQFALINKPVSYLKEILKKSHTQITKALLKIAEKAEFTVLASPPIENGISALQGDSEAVNYLKQKENKYSQELLLEDQKDQVLKALSPLGKVGTRVVNGQLKAYLLTEQSTTRSSIVSQLEKSKISYISVLGPEPVFYHSENFKLS